MPNRVLRATEHLATLPVSRGRALERAALRMAPGAALVFMGLNGISELNFASSPTTNRITEYAFFAILAPMTGVGLTLTLTGTRWALLALWPGPLGIFGDRGGLTFRLGPMGRRRFDIGGLDVTYPFERSLDTDDPEAVYESLIDPQIQMAEMLPRIGHPDADEPLERRILRFVRMNERRTANALRPFIEFVRRDRPAPSSDE